MEARDVYSELRLHSPPSPPRCPRNAIPDLILSRPSKEHDPEDPRQLSFARKWFVTVLMSINCFICVLGTSDSPLLLHLPQMAHRPYSSLPPQAPRSSSWIRKCRPRRWAAVLTSSTSPPPSSSLPSVSAPCSSPLSANSSVDDPSSSVRWSSTSPSPSPPLSLRTQRRCWPEGCSVGWERVRLWY